MSNKADTVIQSYVNRNYGNLIGARQAVFDKSTKKWVAQLESDYPRVIQDDRENGRRFIKFLALRGLGEVTLDEDLGFIEATRRNECIQKVNMLLSRWQHSAEQIVVSASAFNLAKIGMVKDTLNPIVMILSNFLREGKEKIFNDEIDKLPRPQRMRQYFKFLEQISLIEKVPNGYGYAPLFTEIRRKAKDDEEFKNIAIGHIIKGHYSTIRGFFKIWRFEPFVHVDNCYYRPALEAEAIIARREDSLIAQYHRWYGQMSEMRLMPILDELVRVEVLEREGKLYYGKEDLWKRMIALKQQLPEHLTPMRA